ncbi:MAG: hypothetical protein U0L76_06670 [Ruminococcus sp.]|nr:hypothetical protein [Ruminococcus sp.]
MKKSYTTLRIKKYDNNSMQLSDKLVLFILFLSTMNFMGKYFYCIFIAFIIFIFFIFTKKLSLKISYDFIFLVTLSFSFFLFSPSTQSSLVTLFKPLAYPLCYIIGYNFLQIREKSFSEFERNCKVLYNSFIILALGSFVHLCLNMIINQESTFRNTVDVWSEEILNATGQVAFCCIGIGVVCAIFVSVNSLKHKLVALIALVIMFSYNLILSCRTLIFMFAIIILVAIIHFFKEERRDKVKVRFFIILLSVLTLVVLAYSFDWFKMRTVFETSNFYSRIIGADNFGWFDDSRMSNKIVYLKYIFDFPFGGAHIRQNYDYAHDLFFDTWDEAGIFAFISVVIYIICSIVILINTLKNKKIPFQTRQMVLCVYCAFYIEFLIEPVLLGLQWLFATFCIFNSMVNRLNEISSYV